MSESGGGGRRWHLETLKICHSFIINKDIQSMELGTQNCKQRTQTLLRNISGQWKLQLSYLFMAYNPDQIYKTVMYHEIFMSIFKVLLEYKTQNATA